MDHLAAKHQQYSMLGQPQPQLCAVCCKLLRAGKKRQCSFVLLKQTFLVCSTPCEQFCVQGAGWLQGFLLSYLVCDVLYGFVSRSEAGFMNHEFSKVENGCAQTLQAFSSESAELAVNGLGLDSDYKLEPDTVTGSSDLSIAVNGLGLDSDYKLEPDTVTGSSDLSISSGKSCAETVGADVTDTKLPISDFGSDLDVGYYRSAVALPLNTEGLSCQILQNTVCSLPVSADSSSVEDSKLRDLEVESASKCLPSMLQMCIKHIEREAFPACSQSSTGVKTLTRKPQKRQTQMIWSKRWKKGTNKNTVDSSSSMPFRKSDAETVGGSSKNLSFLKDGEVLAGKAPKKTKSIKRQVKEEGDFHCEFCGKEFQVKSYLKKHISRLHSGEGLQECNQCGKHFNSSLSLRSHRYNCHRFSQVCHICGVKFTVKTSFKKHLLAHEGIQRHFCDVCGMGFVHKTSLDKHKFVHVSERSVQCDRCPEMFKAQYLLNQHLLVAHHSGPCFEKRLQVLAQLGVRVDKEAVARHASHQCIICGERLVTGKCTSHPAECQRVFKCTECCLTFDKVISFYKHVKLHRGLNTATSKIRNSRVVRKCSRVKSISPRTDDGMSESVFKCQVCSKQFKKKPYLSIHMHQHKAERFSCEICGKRFTYKCNLTAHLPIHSDSRDFRCNICHKTFKHGFALKSHVRMHGQSEFTCILCEKPFTRNLNLQRHYTKIHPDFKPG